MGKREGVRLAAPAVPYAACTCSSPTNADSSSSSNGTRSRNAALVAVSYKRESRSERLSYDPLSCDPKAARICRNPANRVGFLGRGFLSI